MVSSRDFLYLRKEKITDSGRFVCYESLDLKSFPAVKGSVRYTVVISPLFS
jgi:hypothetical protein